MIAEMSNVYLTNREWFRNVFKDEEVVLCLTSALECLELFTGYVNENVIDVYAKKQGKYDNVNYHIVKNFDNIEIVQIGGLLCTSVSQTINDMLDDFHNIDEQSLIEALSCYYFSNNSSFSGLNIKPENINKFELIKDWAIEYYSEG